MKRGVEMLVSGQTGEDVMNHLRNVYKSNQTLKSKASLVRKYALNIIQHEQYKTDMDAFILQTQMSEIGDFSPWEHWQCQKSGGKDIWNINTKESFLNIRIMPQNILDCKMNDLEVEECKKIALTARICKNETIQVFASGDDLLNKVYKLLQMNLSISKLGALLLFCSGRRLCEVMNGKSTFTTVGRYTALFEGQLKKRNKVTYEIPLLIPCALFNEKLDLLRKKQGNISSLSNEQVSKRYQGNMNRDLKILFEEIPHIHVLRSIYLRFVYHAFDYEKEMTLNLLAMKILGHEDLNQSLHYNSIVIHNITSFNAD